MIAKAAGSDADLVFLDLEDAVAPSRKAVARDNVVKGLNDLDWGRSIRAYRINGVHTQWCFDDLSQVVTEAGGNLDVIIVPKIKSARHVWFVDDLLTQLERRSGLEIGKIGLELLIEETEALASVEEIAAASDRLEALILGVGDLSASQGIRARHIGVTNEQGEATSYPGDIWHYARNRTTVAARANGLDSVDGPYGNFRNESGYKREAAWAATLGAVGKWCIHPNQVALANEVFSPTAEEIEHARSAVDAVREAEEQGQGAASIDGVMIDAATARVFENVLTRAALCGL
jgi:citrate lyase subunit beta/citryl-CoA lyase